jgi:DinB superfamily
MIDYLRKILGGQYEGALCMLNQCVAACPGEHWEGKIARGTFRWAAYHTLFFVDVYLSPSEEAFVMRDLHRRGGDELGPEMTLGLSREETLEYVQICRRKAAEVLASETREVLEGPCGFPRKMTRGELHIYNIRHVQHHTGQMSAYLRRADGALADPKALPWVGTGWRGA